MSAPRVAVAAPGREAVEAALDVARGGGNAVDAAVTAIIVATVTEPGIVSPMGGGFVNVWEPGREPVVVDGNGEMPGRERPAEAFGAGVHRFEIPYGGGLVIFGGHGSVATPGMFAGLDEASRRWGALPWAELVRPAAHVARTGYPLGAAAEYFFRNSGTELFVYHPDTRAFLAQDGTGRTPALGQILTAPDLADSLEAIARDGAATLYTGELAAVIAADMDANEGLLGAADLAAYRPVVRPALRSPLGRWDAAVNPAPSIGGPVLTTMLRLLSRRREEHGRVDAGDILQVQRLVLAYRHRVIDRAHDLELAGREIIELLEELGPDGIAAVCASPETIHVSAVDADGLACSITTSAGYGSGVTTPGTGLMLNNALGEPELNRRGLHALAPGTRLASNMAPTTARRDDGAVLAIGSPGADRITTALMQALEGICLDGLSIQEAIDHPRLHVTVADDGAQGVQFESDPGLGAAVAASGLPAVEHEGLSMFFGGVGAAERCPDGHLEAAGDPRRASATGVG